MIQTDKKVRPLYDRVLGKRLDDKEKTAGGIIIPDSAQEKTQLGTIVATGEGKITAEGAARPLKVKDGDTILFGKYSGTEFKLENEEFLILKEDEILGIVEK